MYLEGQGWPGSGSISQRHGSADLDPPQNVMDPQPGLRIRIHFIRIRIQLFRLNTDPDPIRIRIPSGSNTDPDPIFFISKTTIYLSLGLHKESPSYRRSLQLSKAAIQHFKTWTFQKNSTFVGHFCPPGSGSGFRIRIRIRIQSGSGTLSATLGIWMRNSDSLTWEEGREQGGVLKVSMSRGKMSSWIPGIIDIISKNSFLVSLYSTLPFVTSQLPVSKKRISITERYILYGLLMIMQKNTAFACKIVYGSNFFVSGLEASTTEIF